MTDANAPSAPTAPTTATRKWRPLNPTQRRVVGVLVEKAKTTPEQYPLSLNALATGCNQKNNRNPLTNLTPEQVEQAIDELRQMGAVIEVQSSGRVPKFKHCLYEWLDVDKVELAVMAELLLRGEQTIGELRSRAARMEPIPDLTALRPILQRLKDKQLLLELTPEGRGQLVSHNLYKDRELGELQARAALLPVVGEPPGTASLPAPEPTATRVPTPGITRDMFNELQLEVAELRAEVGRLRGIVQQLTGGL